MLLADFCCFCVAINDPSFSSLVPVSTNSSEAMSLYLINTLLQYKESRYGAFRYAPGNASTGVYADAVELFYNTTFYHCKSTLTRFALLRFASRLLTCTDRCVCVLCYTYSYPDLLQLN
jgi:hypothetical protein